jgi:2-keto-4-pentenoate hydratase/2-oxohepta-3-ene-1,7-dioic acid hydratase in catechol pathway
VRRVPLRIDLPGKIICIGRNYRDHVAETGSELPTTPVLFAKWSNSLIGPGDPIVIPPGVEDVDYEAELGVVIGRRVSRISPENALEAVRGYCCVNDVSARALQRASSQWSRGKSPDTFCPVGELVAAAEIADPQSLSVRAILNGEVMQDGTTRDMVFSVAELIADITQQITLEPGDLIATGTPAGVGYVRTPPVFLRPGDEITIEIEGLPPLTNPVRAEGAASG